MKEEDYRVFENYILEIHPEITKEKILEIFNILKDFHLKMSEQKELDPEINQIVNNNFNNLI